MNSDDKINTKRMLNYLIGINHKTKTKISNPEVRKFSDINKIKNICISSRDDNDVKNLLKDILINYNEKKSKKVIEIGLLGESYEGVGKTRLIDIIMNNLYHPPFSTISIDKYIKKIKKKNGKELKLKIWDTPSQEYRRSLILYHLRFIDCAFLIYDITDRESFDNLKKLYQEIMENMELKLIYLIENKIDKKDERKVNEEEAIEFANKNNLRFFKISCKLNIGITELMRDVGNKSIKIIENYYWDEENDKVKNIKKKQ